MCFKCFGLPFFLQKSSNFLIEGLLIVRILRCFKRMVVDCPILTDDQLNWWISRSKNNNCKWLISLQFISRVLGYEATYTSKCIKLVSWSG